MSFSGGPSTHQTYLQNKVIKLISQNSKLKAHLHDDLSLSSLPSRLRALALQKLEDLPRTSIGAVMILSPRDIIRYADDFYTKAPLVPMISPEPVPCGEEC